MENSPSSPFLLSFHHPDNRAEPEQGAPGAPLCAAVLWGARWLYRLPLIQTLYLPPDVANGKNTKGDQL